MHWTVADVVLLFAVIALVIGLVLTLSVVVKRDADLEHDRANTTRATLFLLLAFAIAVVCLCVQRNALSHQVNSMLH